MASAAQNGCMKTVVLESCGSVLPPNLHIGGLSKSWSIPDTLNCQGSIIRVIGSKKEI